MTRMASRAVAVLGIAIIITLKSGCGGGNMTPPPPPAPPDFTFSVGPSALIAISGDYQSSLDSGAGGKEWVLHPGYGVILRSASRDNFVAFQPVHDHSRECSGGQLYGACGGGHGKLRAAFFRIWRRFVQERLADSEGDIPAGDPYL